MNDLSIIELYFARDEEAIKQTDIKYGKLCHSVAYNILNNNEDSEECVNDTYIGVWNAIPPAKPNSLLSFVCRIVRNLSLKRYAQRTAAKRNSHYDVALEELQECLAASTSIEEEIAQRELAQIIEAFLDTLSRQDRVIFLRRYWFSDAYADIAARLGLSEKNVSVRLTRIRKELRKYLLEREVLG